MKTVCKKLLCLMLVAMMLVSAVPFASATLITPIGPGTVTEVGGNTNEEQNGPSDSDEVTATLTVFDANDETVASKAAEEFTRADMKDIKRNGMSWVEDLLDYFGCDIDASLVKSVAVFGDVDNATSFQILMTLKATTNDGGNQNPGTPSQPQQPVQPDIDTYKCELYIDYNGHATNRTQVVSMGTKYLSVVGEPARPGYNFMGWYSDNLDDFVGRNDKITDDDTITAIWEGPLKYSLTFDVNRKGVEPINTLKQVTYGQAIGKLPTPKAKDYVFLGWKLNGKMINENTVYELQGDATAYAVWAEESDIPGVPSWGGIIENFGKGKVYLEIYTNGDVKDLVRRIDITDYADDHKITRSEAEKVAKKYVTAKSGYSLKYEGLFDEQGWWDYCHDRETDGEEYVRVNREGDEYVYIMVKNVKKAVADSSNPKTGDNIMIAVGTMAMSAAALVSIIELKKRKMI